MNALRFAGYRFWALALLAGGLLSCGEGAVDRSDEDELVQQIQGALRRAASQDPVAFRRVNPVGPILTCVDRLAGHRFAAHFGYTNQLSSTVTIPVGLFNRLLPGPINRGQPTRFHPGAEIDAIQVPFGASGRVLWVLGSHVAIATRFSRPCRAQGTGGSNGAGGAAAAGVGGDSGSGGDTGAGGSNGVAGDTGAGGSNGVGGAGGSNDAGGDAGLGGQGGGSAGLGGEGQGNTRGSAGLGGNIGTGGASANLRCQQCEFGVQPGQEDLCSSAANGCFNCDPQTAGCDAMADATDRALCRDAYACLVAQQHPDSSVPGPCGDPLACWCGSNLLSCGTEPNGPCLQQVLAAGKSADPEQILQTLLDPTSPLTRAVNLANCNVNYCAKACDLPWFERCVATDACHVPGTRDPLTLVCTTPVSADGVECDDGDPSTVADRCFAGRCRGVQAAALGCQQCTFGAGQPDVCSSTSEGCGNCAFLTPCYYLDEPGATQCQALYACLVAPSHPGTTVPGACISLGDPSACFCGSNASCASDGAPASQADGPCLQLLRDYNLVTDDTLLSFDLFFDPTTALGQATNLASCQSFACSPECAIP